MANIVREVGNRALFHDLGKATVKPLLSSSPTEPSLQKEHGEGPLHPIFRQQICWLVRRWFSRYSGPKPVRVLKIITMSDLDGAVGLVSITLWASWYLAFHLPSWKHDSPFYTGAGQRKPDYVLNIISIPFGVIVHLKQGNDRLPTPIEFN